MTTARALARTWAAAWAEAVANRKGFVAQILVMVVNDLMWVVFWTVFFGRVGTLRGWDTNQVLVLFSVVAAAFGVVLGATANSRVIPELAASGGYDAVLALPVPPLPYLLLRRVAPPSVGDIAFGVGLFLAVGHPTPARLAAFAFGVACASLALLGFMVLTGSAVFWGGPPQAGELGLHGLMVFAMYPADVFGGALRLALYGLVPAALIGTVPTRLISHLDLPRAGALLAGSALFAAAGVAAFQRGLRRYTSGATWTDA